MLYWIYGIVLGMKLLRFIVTSLLLFSCIVAVYPSVVQAVSFPAEYDVLYVLNADASVHVTETITITNETDNQYPSQYSLVLEGIQVENLVARDSSGALAVTTEQIGDSTLVSVRFNQIVIGRGNKLTWVLEYDAPTLLKKKGLIYEISLPQVQRDEQIRSYVINIQSAVELGDLDYSDPLPDSYERDEQFRSLRYDFSHRKEPIGVVLAFGNKQLVDARLLYHLANPHSYSAIFEIALPPSFPPYQKTYLQELVPEPYGVRIDEEQNVFAQYKLGPGQRLLVEFIGQIISTQATLSEIQHAMSSTPSDKFLSADTYWEIGDPMVQDIVKKLNRELGEDASDEQKARAVYDYVTQTLMYDTKKLDDLESIERHGAVRALKVPDQAICTDFTDVTVTLMRAMGIPAREVNGYAFTETQDTLPTINDVLHAWVQVYLDGKGWIQIDPTWGSTAQLDYFSHFDTNHVIFALKGLSSEYPYPAGSYKIEGETTEDVHMAFANTYQHGGIPVTLWAQRWEDSNQTIDIIDWLFRWFLQRRI